MYHNLDRFRTTGARIPVYFGGNAWCEGRLRLDALALTINNSVLFSQPQNVASAQIVFGGIHDDVHYNDLYLFHLGVPPLALTEA